MEMKNVGNPPGLPAATARSLLAPSSQELDGVGSS